MTLRLPPDQWRRSKDLCLDLNCTMSELVIAGLNRVFTERGLEPLDPASTILPP
jgi:hypothetical protein